MGETNYQTLLHQYRRRLEKLKEQQAVFGVYTPPYVLTEIEDVEAEIARLELQAAGESPAKVESSGRKHIKILFLAANPLDTVPLRLDYEVRAIDQALRLAEFRDLFEIRQHWAVRASDLQGLLMRYSPTIVHFSGHGSRSGEIILEDNIGQSHPVSAQTLSALFSVLRDEIRCVLLNACYSEIQAHAIAQAIDCVVGITNTIGDQASIRFSTAFYQALGYGRDLKTAFDLACLELDAASLDDSSQPKLLAKRTDPATVLLL